MSGVLDQVILEDIQKNCPEFFLSFHKCMSQDPTKCGKQQFELSQCIRAKVPSVQKIQTDCKDKMLLYETCLRAEGQVSACATQLQELRDCASKVI